MGCSNQLSYPARAESFFKIVAVVIIQQHNYILITSINSNDYVPGPVLGAGDRAANETQRDKPDSGSWCSQGDKRRCAAHQSNEKAALAGAATEASLKE